jgi:hypothetical protein
MQNQLPQQIISTSLTINWEQSYKDKQITAYTLKKITYFIFTVWLQLNRRVAIYFRRRIENKRQTESSKNNVKIYKAQKKANLEQQKKKKKKNRRHLV